MRRNKVDPTADGEIKLLMRQTSIVHRDAEHEVDHEVEISTLHTVYSTTVQHEADKYIVQPRRYTVHCTVYSTSWQHDD